MGVPAFVLTFLWQLYAGIVMLALRWLLPAAHRLRPAEE
jgi:hypothetical protein